MSRMKLIENAEQAPVLICVFDKSLLGEYFQIAAELRAANIRSEVFVGAGNMGKQLKYADRRGVKLAILMGSDELANGEVTIKDLELGAEMAKAIKTNAEWKSSRPAQKTAARDDIVAAVREMLAAEGRI